MPLPLPFLFLFAVAAGSGAALAVLAWRQRPAAGATSLALLCVGTTLWIVGYAFELAADSLGVALFWANVQWFAAPFVPVAWFVFAVEYGGFERYVTRWTVTLLLVIPVATLALVWTNPGELMRASVAFASRDGVAVLEQERGEWFWLDLGYSYALVLVGTVALIARFSEVLSLYLEQFLALSLAAAAPLVANLLSLVVFRGEFVVDVTPFAFVVSQGVCLYALVRRDLLSVRPVPHALARDTVIEHVADGIVVVDESGRVVDMNRSATEILRADLAEARGRDARDLVPAYDRIRSDGRARAVVPPGDGSGCYDLLGTDLRDARGRPVGHAVVFRDVTERQLHLQGLDVLNRVLRHNLRNEMNVFHGYGELIEAAAAGPDPDLDEVTRLSRTIERRAFELVDLADKAQDAHAIFEEYDRDRTPVELSSAIQSAVAVVRGRYPDAVVEVESLPAVACDPVVELVVRNLIENGVEHNPTPRPRVSVRAEVTDGTVAVTVTDDGPGIPESELAVIEAGEETPLLHGSGMGLWLVTWGVRLAGGTLAVEEPPDGGTAVTVRVPRGGD